MKTWMVLAALAALTSPAHAQHAASAANMVLLGHHDLQGRSAYQPVIHEQNGRWIAYVGHHGGRAMNSLTGREEDSGTSIVEVTDPRKPRYLAHIPGELHQSHDHADELLRPGRAWLSSLIRLRFPPAHKSQPAFGKAGRQKRLIDRGCRLTRKQARCVFARH